MDNQRLSVKGLGLAFGLVWSLSVLFIGLLAWLFAWGMPVVEILGTVYIGYEASLIGVIIGAVWGFVDGFIGGVIFAWIYNYFAS